MILIKFANKVIFKKNNKIKPKIDTLKKNASNVNLKSVGKNHNANEMPPKTKPIIDNLIGEYFILWKFTFLKLSIKLPIIFSPLTQI